jgi:cytochrome P450
MLADPLVYADERRLHEALTLLREQEPVQWVEPSGYRPFWAITRHADVMQIERAHHQFLNGPRPVLMSMAMEEQVATRKDGLRTLIHLDGPDHRRIRAAGAGWFKSSALDVLQENIREHAKRRVGKMIDLGGECDFAVDIAKPFPLNAILSLLGLPESQHETINEFTKGMRGVDPDVFISSQDGLFDYFQEVIDDRLSHPTDDLASAVVNAQVDGVRLSRTEIICYFIAIATAGHDTTGALLSGALHALIQHPDQLDRLQQHPELMPLAVDEMIRWVTPTKSFMRTAVGDYDLNGVTIRAGDAVLLNYASANRDARVFEDPFRFDIGRSPNRHLAFGFGVHYCLGAALAKIEIGIFFAELLPRLRHVERAGPPVFEAVTFVGGVMNLPVRYELAS